MYNDLILQLNNSYRKFKEREKEPDLFFHFLALLALKYIYVTMDHLYPFKPDAAITDNLQKILKSDAGLKASFIDKTISQLVKKYPATMSGLFDSISFRNLMARKDKTFENRLFTLIEDINELELTGAPSEANTTFGNAVEYLIEKFVEETFHKKGFLYTPRSLSRLMAQLSELNDTVSIYDPAAGLGTLLIQCAKSEKIADFKLYGQEVEPAYWQLCKMNMLFNGLPKAEIELSDSLESSRFVLGKKEMQFDRIITHPPFHTDNLLPNDPQVVSGKESQEEPSYFVLEEPALLYKKTRPQIHLAKEEKPTTNFFNHILSSLNEKGKAVVIVPHGVLFKLGIAYGVRKELISKNLVEAVIDLPPNIFYSSKVNVSLLILNRNKSHSDILFIDASQTFEPDRRRNKLRSEHRSQVVDTYKNFESVQDYAHKASQDEVVNQNNDYNLTARRYINMTKNTAHADLQSLQANIGNLTRELDHLRKQVDEELQFFLNKGKKSKTND